MNTATDSVQTPRAPSRWALLCESRAAIDIARMWGPLALSEVVKMSRDEARLLIVVPGFGADDSSTVPMRRFLKNKGYRVEGWGLGRNLAGVNMPHTLNDLAASWDVEPRAEYNGEASVPYLCDRLTERVQTRATETGLPVTIIGWSLGGYLAREAARDLPAIVNQVITMGSPTIGGPKYTSAAKFFSSRAMDLDWIETEITKRENCPIQQPITLIYSKSDGVVGWTAAQDYYSANVETIEVNGAHLGLGFNPTVWRHVLTALDRLQSQTD
ncbi:MAG: hypothetical protein AB8F65_13895 [Woeseiaceae bacterium]